jgi:hypothetical protein
VTRKWLGLNSFMSTQTSLLLTGITQYSHHPLPQYFHHPLPHHSYFQYSDFAKLNYSLGYPRQREKKHLLWFVAVCSVISHIIALVLDVSRLNFSIVNDQLDTSKNKI